VRKGQFSSIFLIGLAFLGLVAGFAISFLLTSDSAFTAVILVSVALAIVGSTVRTALDQTDTRSDPRNAAALPLERFSQAGKASAGADPPQPPADSDDEP
jgi:hypothetical protein